MLWQIRISTIKYSPYLVDKNIGPFILLDKLGSGSFSKVFLAKHISTSQLVSIKIISKASLTAQKIDASWIKTEIKLHEQFIHNNILRWYCTMETSNNIYIVTEYCSNLDWLNQIISKGKFTESVSCRYFQQIISAVEYWHSLNIAHRDLKPENVFLTANNEIKLGDFNLCKEYPEENSWIYTPCGSPIYAPPEMILRKPYCGSKADIWSIGVTWYTMVCGCWPFDEEDMQVWFKKIVKGEYEIPSNLSSPLKDLLKKLLEVDPEKRISINEIKEHKWFKVISNVINDKENPEFVPGISLRKETIPIDDRLVLEIVGNNNKEKIEQIVRSVVENKHDEFSWEYYFEGAKRLEQGKTWWNQYSIKNDEFRTYKQSANRFHQNDYERVKREIIDRIKTKIDDLNSRFVKVEEIELPVRRIKTSESIKKDEIDEYVKRKEVGMKGKVDITNVEGKDCEPNKPHNEIQEPDSINKVSKEWSVNNEIEDNKDTHENKDPKDSSKGNEITCGNDIEEETETKKTKDVKNTFGTIENKDANETNDNKIIGENNNAHESNNDNNNTLTSHEINNKQESKDTLCNQVNKSINDTNDINMKIVKDYQEIREISSTQNTKDVTENRYNNNNNKNNIQGSSETKAPRNIKDTEKTKNAKKVKDNKTVKNMTDPRINQEEKDNPKTWHILYNYKENKPPSSKKHPSTKVNQPSENTKIIKVHPNSHNNKSLKNQMSEPKTITHPISETKLQNPKYQNNETPLKKLKKQASTAESNQIITPKKIIIVSSSSTKSSNITNRIKNTNIQSTAPQKLNLSKEFISRNFVFHKQKEEMPNKEVNKSIIINRVHPITTTLYNKLTSTRKKAHKRCLSQIKIPSSRRIKDITCGFDNHKDCDSSFVKSNKNNANKSISNIKHEGCIDIAETCDNDNNIMINTTKTWLQIKSNWIGMFGKDLVVAGNGTEFRIVHTTTTQTVIFHIYVLESSKNNNERRNNKQMKGMNKNSWEIKIIKGTAYSMKGILERIRKRFI